MNNPSIVELLDRPEDPDVWGWSGPGWYVSDYSGTDLSGPFSSEHEALEYAADEMRQYEEWLARQQKAEGDYFPVVEDE